MRRFLLVVIVCGIVSASQLTQKTRATRHQTIGQSSATQNPPRDERLWQRALAIHRRAIVIDTHNDITTGMSVAGPTNAISNDM